MKHFTPTPVTPKARGFLATLLAYLLISGQVAPVALAANASAMRAAPAAAASRTGAGEAQRLAEADMAAPAAAAAGITADKVDSWDDTATPDGKAEPGQEIGYAVTVTNNGPDSAPLTFTDTIDANTTLVPGSVTMSPLARNDGYTSSLEAALNVNAASGVLANDSGLPAPTAAGVVGCADTTAPFECATAKGGTVSLAANGSFTYTPPNDPNSFTGADSFSYTATNSNAPDDTALVTIGFNPSAVNDTATVNEDSGANTINVISNDVDPDGGTNTITSVTQPTNGTVAITNGGADLTYTPNADYCNTDTSTPDTFTYTLSPGGDTATVSVNVTCVDDAPVAVDDTATVNEDSGANTINVLANDTDPDGGTNTVQSVTQPANGTVTITNGGADLTYQPNANYCNTQPGGTPDTFTYTLSPGGDTGSVSVTVTCVDDNPTAVADAATVPEDSAATPINVLANDTDPDGGSISITSVTQPANGAAVITGGGTGLTYQPNANYCNTQPGGTPDTFTYTLSPGGSTATVSVTVTCLDDAPVAVDDTATVAEDSGANTVNVLSNDTDIDGGPKTVVSVTQGTNGTVAITNAGADVSYTPNANFFGSDSFTYTLNGGSTATVSVTVTPVNDAPVAGTDSFQTIGNTELRVDLAAGTSPNVSDTTTSGKGVLDNDSDPVEGHAVAVTGIVGCADTSAPFDCTVSGQRIVMEADGKFSYTPAPGATSGTFQYTVTDDPAGAGTPASATGTVNITIFDMVWYVKASAPPGGNGTSTNPFQDFSSLNGAGGAGDSDAPGHYIFVHAGSYTASLELEASQFLYGEGHGLSLNRNLNGNGAPTVLVPAGTYPTLSGGASSAIRVTAALPSEIRGISASSTGANAVDMTSTGAYSGASSLTIAGNNFTGSVGETVDVNAGATGTRAVLIQNNLWSGTHTGNGIDVNTTAGSLSLDISGNNVGVNANGIVVNSTVAFANTITGFANNTISGNVGNTGIAISNALFDATPGAGYDTVSGGATAVGASGNGVGGAGVLLANVRGDLSFTDLDIFADNGGALSASSNAGFNAAGAGLRISVNSGAGTFAAVGGPALDATLVLLSLPSITLSTSASPTFGVNLNDTDGSTVTTVAGSTINTSNAAATAYRVNNSTGGTYTHAGTINTTAGKGVELTTNPGATISFTNDLIISSGTQPAFVATGGGTVTATDTDNTLTTTTATALNVANTTIGSGGLKFRSISAGTGAGGPASGIILNNTGSTAGLTVSGSGTAGSGGTIQNTTGDAISLTNCRDVSFDRMVITSPDGSGVNGTLVTNFSFTNSTITDAGNASEESAIAFNTNKTTANNIAGTLTITGNTLTNSFYSGVDVQSGDGTVTNANVSNNTINTTNNGQGINFVGVGTATTAFRLENADINQNNISNTRAAGIQVQAGSGSTGSVSGVAGLPGDATKRIDITNNSVTIQAISTQAIAVVTGSDNPSARAKMNFLIQCNGKNTGGCTSPTAAGLGSSAQGTVVLVGNNGYSDMSGVIDNNVITATHTPNLGGGNGIGGGNGVSGAGNAWTPDLTLTVTNNVISGTDGNGILLVGRQTSGFADLKITGNNVGAPTNAGGSARPGIRVDAGNASSADDGICLNMSSNTSAGSNGSPGVGVRKQGTVANVNDFGIVGLAPSPANPTQVEDYLSAQNPASVLGTAATGVKRAIVFSGDNYVNCNTAPAGPVTSAARTFERRSTDSPAVTSEGSVITPRGRFDTDPTPAFGLINGKLVTIPDRPAINRPAVNSAPVTTKPTAARPAADAPARMWSDMPAVIVVAPQRPAADAGKGEKADEAEKAGEAEKTDAQPESDSAAPAPKPAAPKSRVKRTETYRPQEGGKQAKPGVRNISYVGPLGSAPSSAPRFADASYAVEGAPVITATRTATAKPAATRARARARTAPLAVAGETVNVTIGAMPSTKSVVIRFRVTVNNPFTGAGDQVSNQGTVSDGATVNVPTDDPSVGGASDPTVTPINTVPAISALDAKGSEPGELLFTIALSKPATSPVTVNYATADGGGNPATANVDYTPASGTATFAVGEQLKTVAVTILSNSPSNEPDETVLLNLSTPAGGSLSDDQATGTITEDAAPGTILISELRTSGPGGTGDDFVEVYNNSNSPVTVTVTDGSNGWGLFKMGADCNATPVLVGTIPKDTTILPGRGHYLFTGPQYSLKDYGGTDAALGNTAFPAEIESDRNVGLFNTTNVTNLSSATRLDAVGFGSNSGGNCSLLREGTNLGPASGSALEHSYFRRLCDFVQGQGCQTPGTPKDTGDNAGDFTFADTSATQISGTGQRLGAPGPENMGSPRKTDLIASLLLDSSVAAAAPPNRVRNLSAGDPSTSSFGTMTIRRRFVNNTGGDVTRLRFRISEMTTFPPGSGQADLRALTSMNVSVMSVNDPATCSPNPNPCTVNVAGTTLEQPPTQPIGGGLNATLTVTLGTPLSNGAAVNVQFLLGVQNPGLFRFLIITEALP